MALLAAAACLFAQAAAARHDIVVRGGQVLDGAGNPWIRADVAIRDGRIVHVGTVPEAGEREIDATGKLVVPGFIDMMDQSGRALLKNGDAENKIRMGVTTVIAGEGGTPVPAADIPGYFARLEGQGIAVNFATYYSSAQARRAVMGDVQGRPAPAQVAEMRREVAAAMRAGAFGVSSALVYPPGSFQSTEDLVALAQAAGECGGYYATHVRDEAAGLPDAVAEAIEIGERSGAKVEIFHLKAGYRPGRGRLMAQAIARIEAARARGVDVAADLYPYAAAGTGLDITVPAWVWEDGTEEGHRRLRDPRMRERMKRDLAQGSSPGWSNFVEASGGWGNVMLANAYSEPYRRYHGVRFSEIGAALGKDPADAAWDILLGALPNRAYALYFMMDEADVELALRQPWVSIGSDASAALRHGEVDEMGLPHPRAYGTMVRVITEYVQRRGVLTLEEAVRRMTGWPASRMGLADRGLIRSGMHADVVVLDLERLEDRASYANPLLSPAGVETVIVNGVLTFSDGAMTGRRAGAVLRHSCAKRG